MISCWGNSFRELVTPCALSYQTSDFDGPLFDRHPFEQPHLSLFTLRVHLQSCSHAWYNALRSNWCLDKHIDGHSFRWGGTIIDSTLKAGTITKITAITQPGTHTFCHCQSNETTRSSQIVIDRWTKHSQHASTNKLNLCIIYGATSFIFH